MAFIAGSLMIAELSDHITQKKDLFYCWLLVFFNAYIGTFIANQAIKRDSIGFLVWTFLMNGLRAGVFLFLLLSVVKWDVSNVRAFVLMTFFGYFAFLAAEISGLLKHTKEIAKDPQCGKKDDQFSTHCRGDAAPGARNGRPGPLRESVGDASCD
ncbi:hypothetical protein P4C99_04420 [Pontiellaceae bacterium B1224]|nr:hypothetical protein [Pontiellaceae bacterium B1224]